MTDTSPDLPPTADPTPRGRVRVHQSRLLAGLTRARLLGLLREDRGLSVSDLAAELGLHPNSVRDQLDQLVDAGLAERAPATPRGRGRPPLQYRATPQHDEGAPYRDLARVLAEELARVPDPATRAIAAGERWGRDAIRPEERPAATFGEAAAPTAGIAPPATGSGREAAGEGLDPIGRLLVLLDASGFAPEPLAEGGPIRLRRCPFLPLATEQREVVCGVHLGLMRGALDALGAPLDAVRLEPFVEPDLCLAHLGPRDRGSAG
ncbi:MAG TPA: helix-turn-helix domain-containing protein [Candidatus Limnocylindrales bacterium]|nr:helix-turn-helix domain-containing protein [Candidatus Limnocylindrales bacterium]